MRERRRKVADSLAEWRKERLERPVREVLEGEIEAVGARKSERSEARVGYRAGYYTGTLVTRVGKLVLRVPQDRQGRFRTEVFERYQRSLIGPEGQYGPFRQTVVKAEISSATARVRVTQQCENTFPGKIEAVHVFPLPPNVAMRGAIKRREAARAIPARVPQRSPATMELLRKTGTIVTGRIAMEKLEGWRGWIACASPRRKGNRKNGDCVART